MSIRPIISLAMAVALLAPEAARAQYTYTRIATTGAGSNFAGLFPPQINQVGSVAFGATLTDGNQGIFVGTLGQVVTIVRTPDSNFTGFNIPPGPIVATIAPNSNTTAFFATRTPIAGGGAGIFTTDTVTGATIASTTQGFTSFGVGVDINSGNNVAFSAATGPAQGVFIGAPGAPQLTTVATNAVGTLFSNFHSNVAVNNSGITSYAAGLKAGGFGIFRFTPSTGATVSVAATGVGSPFANFPGPTDINNAVPEAAVAFVAGLTSGASGVFRGNTLQTDTIATTGTSYSLFGTSPSMNTPGTVAFAATLVAGGEGIFTGSNPLTDKVIRTGDALDGSTVMSVALASGALNDLGQLAFVAQLANGRQVIVLATPVPEPASVLLLGGSVLAAGAWWRRRTRSSAGGPVALP